MSDPIRVFVGASSGEDTESQAVLEYTLRKYASRDVEIVWMQQAARGFWSRWNTERWATPFTGFRWGIPAFCGFEGRAIYCDSDVIFRADVAGLFDQPLEGEKAILLRGVEGKLRTCVMLMDCAKLRAHLPSIDAIRAQQDPNGAMRQYLMANRQLLGQFDGDWNCIDLKGCDGVEDPRIRLIHYSQMSAQPHLARAIGRLAKENRSHWYDGEIVRHWRPELVALFDRELEAAEAAGYTVDRYRAPAIAYRKKSWKHYTPPKERRG